MFRKPYAATNPTAETVDVNGTVVRPFFTEHVWCTLQEALALRSAGWTMELRNLEAENHLIPVETEAPDTRDYTVASSTVTLNSGNSFAAEAAALTALTAQIDVTVVNDQEEGSPAAASTFLFPSAGRLGQRVIFTVDFDTAGDTLTLNATSSMYLNGVLQADLAFSQAGIGLVLEWDEADQHWNIIDHSATGIAFAS